MRLRIELLDDTPRWTQNATRLALTLFDGCCVFTSPDDCCLYLRWHGRASTSPLDPNASTWWCHVIPLDPGRGMWSIIMMTSWFWRLFMKVYPCTMSLSWSEEHSWSILSLACGTLSIYGGWCHGGDHYSPHVWTIFGIYVMFLNYIKVGLWPHSSWTLKQTCFRALLVKTMEIRPYFIFSSSSLITLLSLRVHISLLVSTGATCDLFWHKFLLDWLMWFLSKIL